MLKDNYYQKNVQIISSRKWDYLINEHPTKPIKSINSKIDKPTIKYNGVYVHSLYDPIKEAKKLVQIKTKENISLVFVMGLGYGYHVLELLEQLKEQPCLIFIFEQSEELFQSALHYTDLSFLEDLRIYLFVNNKHFDLLQSIILDLRVSHIKGIYTLYLQSEYGLFKKEYDDLLQRLHLLIQQQFQNQFTSLEFEKIWLKNIILNSPKLTRHSNLSTLFNQFESVPALIVSAGPSLSESLHDINKVKDRMLIFSTDTALSTLLAGDIIPDFIISLDAQLHNFKDFITLNKSTSTTLIYDLSVYPKIPDWVHGKHFYFTSVHHNEKVHPFIDFIQRKLNISIGSVLSGSSVAATAIEISRLMGCKPIILLGQDLSYTKMMTHAASSPLYNHFIFGKSSRLTTIEGLFFNTIHARKLVTIKEKTGLKTDFVLKNLNQWLAKYAAIYTELLFNATNEGFNINNVQNISLMDFFIKNQGIFLTKNEKKDKIMAAFSVKNNKSFDCKELLAIYIDLAQGLRRFFDLLNHELTSYPVSEENIIMAKRNLVLEFPFLTLIYEKDDLWYLRKTRVEEHDKQLYANILLKSTEGIIKNINHILKNEHKKDN